MVTISVGWVGVTVDTFFVGFFWTNMEKLSIMMPNFIYNVWMVLVTVNQSTFYNRVLILQTLRLRKGIVKIGVQSDPCPQYP